MNHHYPEAYVKYLCLFHASRDYFECHEVLEDYWKKHPASAFRQAWVGLIQIAVALYHERSGNVQGAIKSLQNAMGNLPAESISALGIDTVKLPVLLADRISKLEYGNRQAYMDINLPISDQELIDHCLAWCKEHGLAWLAPSNFSNDELIFKHRLRDRSGVISARKAEIERRKGKI